MSLRKQSRKRVEQESHRRDPTVQEVNNLIATMTMDEIRATSTFQKMDKSVFGQSVGHEVPKSALRRRDLAFAYLKAGGQVIEQKRKKLKNFKPSVKKTSVEKKLDKHTASLTKDHKGNLSQLRHGAAAARKPVIFHGASPSLRLGATTSEQYDDEHDENSVSENSVSENSDSEGNNGNDMDELTDELSLTLSMQDTAPKQRRTPLFAVTSVDDEF